MAGQTLHVTVKTVGSAPLSIVLRVGAHVLANVNGRTDAHGVFSARLPVHLDTKKPVTATLDPQVDATFHLDNAYGCPPSHPFRSIPVTILPHHVITPLAGPQLLHNVLSDAFPVHHGVGDRGFAAVEALAVPGRADDLGLGWERVQIRWDQLQPRGPLQWNANATPGAPPHDHPDALFNHETAQGRFVRHIGRQGNTPGRFAGPHAVSVAPDGTLWVADTFNARIQHLTATGDVLSIPLTHVNGAWGVASDGVGGVYHWTGIGQQVWGAPGSGGRHGPAGHTPRYGNMIMEKHDDMKGLEKIPILIPSKTAQLAIGIYRLTDW